MFRGPYNKDPIINTVFGGSGVVISGVISPLIWVISIATLLITLLMTTHEPPSTPHHVGKSLSRQNQAEPSRTLRKMPDRSHTTASCPESPEYPLIEEYSLSHNIMKPYIV